MNCLTLLALSILAFHSVRIDAAFYGSLTGQSSNAISAQKQLVITEADLPIKYGGNNVASINVGGQLGCISFNGDTIETFDSMPSNAQGKDDPSLICPFQTVADINSNSLYYLTLYDESDQDLMIELTQDIKQVSSAFVPATFEIKQAVLITWTNLKYGTSANRNNFQLAIATAASGETYAILNYNDLPLNGAEGGSQFGKAGFNLGRGRGWFPLPFSGKAEVTKLSTYSTVINKAGRYIYKVSDAYPQRLGCLSLSSSDMTSAGGQPLTIAVSTGTVFGGERVVSQGACLVNVDQSKLTCGFQIKSTWTTTRALLYDSYTAVCKQPQLPDIDAGWTKMGLSIDSGNTFNFLSDYYISLPEPTQYAVRLSNRSAINGLSLGSPLNISWDPSKFLGSNPNQNVTLDVEVVLVGYTQANGAIKATDLKTVGTAKAADGFYLIDPQVTCDAQCANTVIGQIQVRLPTSSWSANGSSVFSLSSGYLPFGWFTNKASSSASGNNWYSNLCPSPSSVTPISNRLSGSTGFTCPCNISQVYNEARLFLADSDPECNDQNCLFDSTVKPKCFITIAGPSGIGLRCCYDVYGSVIYTQDRPLAGSYAINSPPSAGVSTISSSRTLLSYYLNDIASYLTCCSYYAAAHGTLPTKCYSFADTYTIPQNCTVFQPNGVSAVVGDPHFLTADGTSFTMNNLNEFWYVKSAGSSFGNFSMQLYLDVPLRSSSSSVAYQASFLRGVAAAFEDSPVVNVHVNVPLYQAIRNLRVMIDGTEIVLANAPKQMFRNVRVISDTLQSKVTVIGMDASFQCQYSGPTIGSMFCTFNISSDFKGRLNGLVGNWDGYKQNDLLSSTGVNVSESDMWSVYTVFGDSWRVNTVNSSMFTHINGQAFSNFNSTRTYATYLNMTPPTTLTEENITQTCNPATMARSAQCRFDLSVTLLSSFAVNTQTQLIKVDQQQASQSNSTGLCALLNIPYSIKSSNTYTVGSSVTVSGCVTGYSFVTSSTTYRCVNGGNGIAYWEPTANSGSCIIQVSVSAASTDLIIAIVVPICVLLLLLAAGAAYYFLVYKKKAKKEKDAGNPVEDDTPNMRKRSLKTPDRTPPVSEIEPEASITRRSGSASPHQADSPSKTDLHVVAVVTVSNELPRDLDSTYMSSRHFVQAAQIEVDDRQQHVIDSRPARISHNESIKSSSSSSSSDSSTSSVDSIQYDGFRKREAENQPDAVYVPMSSTTSKYMADESRDSQRISVTIEAAENGEASQNPPPPPAKPTKAVKVLPTITLHGEINISGNPV